MGDQEQTITSNMAEFKSRNLYTKYQAESDRILAQLSDPNTRESFENMLEKYSQLFGIKNESIEKYRAEKLALKIPEIEELMAAFTAGTVVGAQATQELAVKEGQTEPSLLTAVSQVKEGARGLWEGVKGLRKDKGIWDSAIDIGTIGKLFNTYKTKLTGGSDKK